VSDETPRVKIDEQPVKVQVEESPTRLVKTDDHLSKAPDTTSEENLHSASQRKVNLVWEYSQAGIALMIVGTTCVGIFIGRVWVGSTVPFPAEWWTIVGLVIGFYFGRTNHQRVGGVQSGR
jgi:hypothetical protein